ncbi:MAG: sensor histidine kinase [Planctomycetes bacterium]|nr:sensor histidine kinase [Planctomycetota bacterium]
MTVVAESQAVAGAGDALGGVLREYMAVTERLAATHESLQREVVRLRDELESKDRELERRRRLAALGELAAGVAHEVRNPLGAIQLYSGLLKSKCNPGDEACALIEKIERGIQAIESVVQDTLALTPRGHRLAPRPVGALLAQAADACARAFEARAMKLTRGHNAAETSVFVDEHAIVRVLINLLTNAAEASPIGGAVNLAVDSSDETVVVRIQDSGPGIPADLLDKIFDPFFTTKATGTGLGLAIAHRLIDAHGGRLTVRNAVGGGAEFSVALPVHGPEAAAAGSTGEAEAA